MFYCTPTILFLICSSGVLRSGRRWTVGSKHLFVPTSELRTAKQPSWPPLVSGHRVMVVTTGLHWNMRDVEGEATIVDPFNLH